MADKKTPKEFGKIIKNKELLEPIKNKEFLKKMVDELKSEDPKKAQAFLDKSLEYFLLKGDEKTVKTIIEEGATLTNRVLFRAALRGFTDVVELLLDEGFNASDVFDENFLAESCRGIIENENIAEFINDIFETRELSQMDDDEFLIAFSDLMFEDSNLEYENEKTKKPTKKSVNEKPFQK